MKKKLGGFSLQNMAKWGKKKEVNYNVIYVTKDNKEIEENKLRDIIAKKILRVILAEEENSVALNNS